MEPITETEAQALKKFCPCCGAKIQQHSLTWWCNSCGWAKNKDGSAERKGNVR